MEGLQELSDEQLVHKVFEAEQELVRTRFRLSMNQLENTASVSVLRKTIARLKTEAGRRERDKGLRKDTLVNAHRASFRGTSEAAEAAPEKGGFLSGIVDKLTGNE
jgi:ribosomal protein L29